MSPRSGYVLLAAAMALIAFGTLRVFAASVGASPRHAITSFIAAVNRGDFRTACAAYSPHYLKASQEECRSLYRWGWKLYGPYRYVVVARHRIGGRYHVELTRRGRADYVDFAREGGDWKVVAGGW